VNPIRREPILDHMRDLVQKCVDKGLLEFAFVHNLIWEYCQQCSGVQSRLNDIVTLSSDSTRKLMSTKPGSRAMCVVISNSSAKDRKKVMKGLKGHVLECLLHEAAHLAVLRLIDVTDDTVNVQKLLLDEMSSTKKTIQYAADGKVTGETVPLLAVGTF
jgi:pumilio homology domain family member 6